ncbi:UNVERIFIED_CONTAM: UDP-glycosyltransferase 71E1 [Sesamum angustifolium]|uniref:UDP-glycosyltransferase 71E1 n=1 Tax=Sesamum angustifolium TaxID=2727405 RepID=A0AAW2IU58_9LAMI
MSEAKTLTSLVFIPLPIISHMVSAVKLAKLLADRDERLSITILVMKLPMEGKISSLTKNPPHSRVNFVKVQTQFQHDSISTDQWMKLPKDFVRPALESQKDLVRDAVAEILKSSSSSKIAAFVIDMFCTSMMDVANELGIPTYVFLPIGLAACRWEQVKEIAVALENSGYRFLWSLRKPPPRESFEFPGEYENPEDVLPKGFLKRTAERGKVIGWAPQMAVLSHPAVGGFCVAQRVELDVGKSMVGVPMAVWPLAAEQQANAFLLGDDRDGNQQLMDPENGVRLKVRALKEKSRLALMEGGSSFNYMKRFIENVMDDVS